MEVDTVSGLDEVKPQRRLPRETIALGVVVMVSLFLADLSVVRLATIAGVSIYISDLIFAGLGVIAVKVLWNRLPGADRRAVHWYVLFVTYLIVLVVRGIPAFGPSAIGELRYFGWFLAFFVPWWLFPGGDQDRLHSLMRRIGLASGASALLLFVAEVLYGGRIFFADENQVFDRLEDFRGMRILGSEETMHLCVLFLLIAFGVITMSRSGKERPYVLLALGAVIVATRNRAAPVAVALTWVVWQVFQKNWRAVAGVALALVVLLGAAWLIWPELIDQVALSFAGVADPTSDPTGGWRIATQLAALDRGLQQPVFGEGFGGYFELYLPDLDKMQNFPVHNVFLHMFMKGGFVGVLLLVVAWGTLVRVAIRSRNAMPEASPQRRMMEALIIILVAQIPYGFAFGFSVFSSLYAGIALLLSGGMHPAPTTSREEDGG